MSRPAPRLYIEGSFQSGAQHMLPQDRSHYLASVLRAQPGMEVRLFNAAMGEWRATVSRIDKRQVTVTLQAQALPPEPEPERCLIFAPIKKTPLEWLVEKATELGVTRFVPILTERTQVRALGLERLQAIATEATEQCERLGVPVFTPLQPLPVLLAQWPQETIIHAALERSDAMSLQNVEKGIAAATILIGPEGGFSDGERQLLMRQPFVQAISLGPRILRAETAALAALSQLLLRQS